MDFIARATPRTGPPSHAGRRASVVIGLRSGLAMLAALLGACAASVTPAPAQAPVPARAQPAVQAPVLLSDARGVLRIRQLDVGQGDAALITTPEGRRILIDAGRAADDVAALLRRERIDTIDLIVASHNHADHIGGMPAVLEAVVVRAYLENGLPHTTATYRRTIAALERERGLVYLQASDRTITVGTVAVRVLASPNVNRTHNDNSVGVIVEHGDFRALYTGDSELAQLAGWARQGRIPRVTVVKVAHHGSHNGTSAELVRAAAPAVALISVGARNSYGHPSPQAERLWRSAGARVFRTDVHGPIQIDATADGRFSVRTGDPPRPVRP